MRRKKKKGAEAIKKGGGGGYKAGVFSVPPKEREIISPSAANSSRHASLQLYFDSCGSKLERLQCVVALKQCSSMEQLSVKKESGLP